MPESAISCPYCSRVFRISVERVLELEEDGDDWTCPGCLRSVSLREQSARRSPHPAVSDEMGLDDAIVEP